MFIIEKGWRKQTKEQKAAYEPIILTAVHIWWLFYKPVSLPLSLSLSIYLPPFLKNENEIKLYILFCHLTFFYIIYHEHFSSPANIPLRQTL